MHFGWREIVFLLVLIAMPTSSYWFVFRPQNKEINAAKAEIEQKEKMLEKLSAATARSRDLARANDEIAAAIGKVESRLPGTKEVDVILSQIAQLARESRLELPKVKSEKPIPYAKYMEQPLSLTMRGDFKDFYEFVLKVEKLDRITRVPDMLVKKAEEIDGAMEASFTLSIYFQPDASTTEGGS